MRLGTLVHEHLHHILSAGPAPEVSSDLTAEFAPIRDAARGVLSLPYNIIATEHPFGYGPLSSGYGPLSSGNRNSIPWLVGRLDGIAIGPDGRFWSVQWKTLGKGGNVGNLMEAVKYSTHECCYRMLLQNFLLQIMPENIPHVAGTLLGVFRTYLTKQQKADNIPIFQFYELEVDRETSSNVLSSTWRYARDFVAGAASTPHYTACFSPRGNCPLIAHCYQHDIDIHALLPELQRDRYADLRAVLPSAGPYNAEYSIYGPQLANLHVPRPSPTRSRHL